MDGIFTHLRFLESTTMARVEHWSAKEQHEKENQQQAKEREQRASEQKRSALEDLWVIREIKAQVAEVAALGGESGEVAVSPEGVVDAAVAGAEREVGTGHDGPAWQFDRPFFRFLPPRKDPQTGKPLYDVSTVSGKQSYRERAKSAAEVHGPEIYEQALAEAIYATGETKAPNATSVRTSLGSLTRYGDEWERHQGWLVYRGDDLTPNIDLIKALVEERRASKFETNDI